MSKSKAVKKNCGNCGRNPIFPGIGRNEVLYFLHYCTECSKHSNWRKKEVIDKDLIKKKLEGLKQLDHLIDASQRHTGERHFIGKED